MLKRVAKITGTIAIVLITVSMVVPIYQKVLIREKETILKNNVFLLRTTLHQYTYDKRKAPRRLSDLVVFGYLGAVPIDPLTKSAASWRIIADGESGILDVRPGSDARSLEGTLYSEW